MPSGYVLDHLALIASMAGTGTEHDRREISRLIHDAINGGPTLHVPALCLAEATAARHAVAGHVAELVGSVPKGAIEICGLIRTDRLDSLRASYPDLNWPAAQAANHARDAELILVSADPDRYSDVVEDRQEL